MLSRVASLAFCCGFAASVGTSDDRQMSLISFASSGSEKTDAARGILCQDGTISGVFFLEASQAKDADKWLIWFEGGADTTSSDWGTEAPPIDLNFGGEEFTTWNQIRFKTCSGDFRSGQRTTPLNGLYHQGHLHVVNGIVEMKKRITTKMSKLLIGGCSVGGHSQVVNVDYIASQMPSDVDVRAWINSGLTFDVVHYPDFVAGKMDARTSSTKEKAEELNTYVDESCRAALGDDWWKCTNFDYAFPYISTPSFVSQAKYDRNQLQHMGAPAGSFTKDTSQWSPDLNNFTAYFGERTRKVFVEAVQGNKNAALFLPSCFDHCVATTSEAPETVTTVTGHSYTAKEAFLAWYHNTQTERFYLDNCTDAMPCNPAADPLNHFSCASTVPSSECMDVRSRVCPSAEQRKCQQCVKAHWDEFEPFCTPDQVKAVCSGSILV